MKRMMMVSLIALLLIYAVPVFAHDPQFETEDWGLLDDPFVLPADPTISFAMYGYLEEADVDAVALDFEEAGQLLNAWILVPVCGEHYTDFYPDLAIIGPGLEIPENADELPFEIPEGMGITVLETPVVEGNEERPTFFEEIGGTLFYNAPEIEFDVPEAGRYYVVAWDNEGMSGDYSLATGRTEAFVSSPLAIASAVTRIRSNGWLHRNCELTPDDPEAMIDPWGHEEDHAHGDDHEHGEAEATEEHNH